MNICFTQEYSLNFDMKANLKAISSFAIIMFTNETSSVAIVTIADAYLE